MKIQLQWTEGMKFNAKADDGNSTPMDAKAPIGRGTALTPKELVAAGLGGCTAMDVVALLKKHKQNYTALDVDVDVTMSSSGQPVVFTGAKITFRAQGDVDKDKLLESVRLSQTKYCGVSAMLAHAFPIHYVVELNGETIGEGDAKFGG